MKSAPAILSGMWRKAAVIWALLTLILAATVTAAYLDLGDFKLPVALAFAVMKAALVIVLFMELPLTRASTRLLMLTGLLFVLVLFGLTFADRLTRPDQPASFDARATFPQDR